MRKKLGIALFFALVVLALVFLLDNSGETERTKKKSFKEPVKNEVVIIENNQPVAKTEAVKKLSPSPLEERNVKITKEVKREFDSLPLPIELPEERLERQVVADKYYLKTSFFLNEVAGGNLHPAQEDLEKAFKVIAAIHKDIPNDGQLPDVLRMVEEDHGAIFNQALRELSKEEESLILKMMDTE